MYLSIKQGSIFVADSHYNQKNRQFLLFLKKLENKEIKTTQLFLMGDMIDFISGESKYFIKRNIEILELLNKLSNEIEIIYLEGNHDYNLKTLFPNINVIKRENQPVLGKLNNKTVILFQTQGAELNSEHSITAFARAASYLGENCKVLGTFASQGKINPAMLERRKNADKNDPHAATPRNLERWQKASMHPNEEDFSRAKEFVKAMQRKIALREKYLNMKK